MIAELLLITASRFGELAALLQEGALIFFRGRTAYFLSRSSETTLFGSKAPSAGSAARIVSAT